MTESIYIAFRHGASSLGDMIVSLATSSKYSHAEIIINNKWWSSTMKEGVRWTTKDTRKGKWDIYEIKVSKAIKHTMLNALERLEGSRYDFFNFIGYLFLPKLIRNNSYFCFEVIDYVLARSLREYPKWGIKLTGEVLMCKLEVMPHKLEKRSMEDL